MEKKKILIINGSLRGSTGNSGAIVQKAIDLLSGTEVNVLTLAEPQPSIKEVYHRLADADALVVISGVYWNNWSSLLQRFIEVMSIYENSPAFFGKPVSCVVSMDSVGGAEVAARLLAVFVNLGCWTPPCSTLVISRVGNEAIAGGKNRTVDPNEDVWRLDDLEYLLHNLAASLNVQASIWKSWPHSSLHIEDGPWPHTGPLDLQSPRFL